ncbi:hypothetical protein AVEN_103299-1 [Araneus ventricosus]|uniref:Uncharacterized protein n=1 Tax=Araneus ventricosus TaxID=182803 RepID=A0A4Y2V990_ARAVE|nr:hypothetical protein AVEN_45881-1 [Araneus ventricosus]GBO21875.1 hypothetical protein AVEN_103299-1 [Araneus ventricosus]
MFGKRVLQRYVWEYRKNGDIDIGDHFGDEMWHLKSTGIFLISLMGPRSGFIQIIPFDITVCWETLFGSQCVCVESSLNVFGVRRISLKSCSLCVLIDFERARLQ